MAGLPIEPDHRRCTGGHREDFEEAPRPVRQSEAADLRVDGSLGIWVKTPSRPSGWCTPFNSESPWRPGTRVFRGKNYRGPHVILTKLTANFLPSPSPSLVAQIIKCSTLHTNPRRSAGNYLAWHTRCSLYGAWPRRGARAPFAAAGAWVAHARIPPSRAGLLPATRIPESIPSADEAR